MTRPCSPPPGEAAALRRRLLSGMRGLTKTTYGLNSAVRSRLSACSREGFTSRGSAGAAGEPDGAEAAGLTSGCTSTIHILFLACTERTASILVPYWFSLYSPCSINLWRVKTVFTTTRITRSNQTNAGDPYLLFKTSASNCCFVTKWYSTPSFS